MMAIGEAGQYLAMGLVAVAVFATLVSLALPYLRSDKAAARLKYVSGERDMLREDRRRKLKEENDHGVRDVSDGFASEVVERLNLQKYLSEENTRDRLKMAGLRSRGHLMTFLFFRFAMPLILFVGSQAFMFLVDDFGKPAMARLGIGIILALIGYYLPGVYLKNVITKRQQVMQRAFPDTLDLLLICVESGMSIEAAFGRVASEIAITCPEMAEEMSLTTAELSYLPERRMAYDNLAKRTGLEGVKAVTTTLVQAEKYGTPLAHALRVMAQENRDMRMSLAEKKAAALPPKLTVPMIVFFLPVLFVVILGPSILKVMMMNEGG